MNMSRGIHPMLTSNQLHILGVWHLASAQDQAIGSEWYLAAFRFSKKLAERYSLPVSVTAGVVAALSPRNKWKRNCVDAENLIAAFNVAGAEGAANVKVCTFHGNKRKAIQILSGWRTVFHVDDVAAVLSGPKLKEFYHCIMQRPDICIDGHAYSIWFGDRVTLANVPSIGKKLREEIKSDYKKVAEHLEVFPSTLQAVTWCAWRRLHEV